MLQSTGSQRVSHATQRPFGGSQELPAPWSLELVVLMTLNRYGGTEDSMGTLVTPTPPHRSRPRTLLFPAALSCATLGHRARATAFRDPRGCPDTPWHQEADGSLGPRGVSGAISCIHSPPDTRRPSSSAVVVGSVEHGPSILTSHEEIGRAHV